jgi:hypothetical protein|tara:strand:- start:659 stop:1033 length:375 start_codon:yes stop_codon:yes gene_type:complete
MIITWKYTAIDNVEVPVLTEDFDSGMEIETFQVTHQYEPISALLSTKTFCAYKDHPYLHAIQAKALAKFKKEWLVELGFDPVSWLVLEDGTIEERGKVKTRAAVENWLKPNATSILAPIETEEI